MTKCIDEFFNLDPGTVQFTTKILTSRKINAFFISGTYFCRLVVKIKTTWNGL